MKKELRNRNAQMAVTEEEYNELQKMRMTKDGILTMSDLLRSIVFNGKATVSDTIQEDKPDQSHTEQKKEQKKEPVDNPYANLNW